MNTEIYDQLKFPLGSVMNGANLFKFNPQLFDRRLENHRFHKRVTGNQREEYLDSLPCVLCGRKGGICPCTYQKEEKKKTKLISLLQKKKEKVETKTINLSSPICGFTEIV